MKRENVSRIRPLAAALTFVVVAGTGATAATSAQAAVRARFSEARGILTVVGDREDNVITVERTSGLIVVNGGAVPIAGGVPSVGNTTRIVVRGGAGDDRLELVEASGALPAATLNGGPGDDLLLGGSNADDLRGGPGDDTLSGSRGDDRLRGDAGNDSIEWRAGEGSDAIDGGAGRDRVRVGAARLRSNRVRLFPEGRSLVVTVDETVPVRLDTGRVERFLLFGGDRADVISAAGDLGRDVAVSIYGGAGADDITGSEGADLLNGNGDGDVIRGMGGNDTLYGENGDDSLLGGDGDDTLHGGSGIDGIDGGPGIDVAIDGELVLNVP